MMETISGPLYSGAPSPAAAERVSGSSPARQADPESPARSPVPKVDRYDQEEPLPPSGRYWPGRDEEGRPKVFFDDPERAAKPEEAPDGPPEKRPGEPEKCTCDTGKVDREIERLRKKQAELERQLGTETDEARIRELERQLSQVGQELRQKDNDTYRRRHAEFS